MSTRKLYEIDGQSFKSYDLITDFAGLEEKKRSYIEEEANKPLFYEITSREFPSWETNDFEVPISTINSVGGIFSRQTETILAPLNPVPKHKQHLLEVFCKHDLMTPSLKLITSDDGKKILYYFLFLSQRYKGNYKLNHFDNILSLSKDLFTYELLLNGDYEHATLSYFEDVKLKDFFGLEQTGEFSLDELKQFLNPDMYEIVAREEQLTHKLVNKISGK